jgi:hypothetical protein
MKIIANYNTRYIDEENNIIVQFKVSNWQSKKVVENIEKEKNYQLDIKEVKSQRSVNQNKFMWKIIHDIVGHLQADGQYDIDEMDLYCYILENANCKYEYLIASCDEVIDKLKQTFRAVKYIRNQDVNGKECKVIKCYLGSSKYNVKEMNVLIEKALDLASNYGLNYENINY